MMKLFIKHIMQMYLCIIGSDTDCANIAVFHLFFIYLHRNNGKSCSNKSWDFQLK